MIITEGYHTGKFLALKRKHDKLGFLIYNVKLGKVK